MDRVDAGPVSDGVRVRYRSVVAQMPFTFRRALEAAERAEERDPREGRDRPSEAPEDGSSAPAHRGGRAGPRGGTRAAAAPERSGAPGAERTHPLSVSALNDRLRGHVERGFGRLWVEGELRSVSVHPRSGHAYFELADARSTVPVFMSRALVQRLGFPLDNGLHVLLEGGASVYEARGRLQLRARRLEPVGEGARQLALRARIARLEAEGLLAAERKRALPPFPRPIGVVTSRSGAALQDVLRTALRRDPRAHLVLAPSAVQGAGAVEDLVRAIRRVDRAGVQVILLVRGGGSPEDLRAFDEEAVARAVAGCRTPVVTGIGHEHDTTLTDLVADERASTPTAAAERVVPERARVLEHLDERTLRLRRALAGRLARAERDLRRVQVDLAPPLGRIHGSAQRLDDVLDRALEAARQRLRRSTARLLAAERALSSRSPEARVTEWSARLEGARDRLERAVARRLERGRAELARRGEALIAAVERDVEGRRRRLVEAQAGLRPAARRRLALARADLGSTAGRLEAMSPLAVLARGYAVVEGPGGAVRSAREVSPGDRLGVRVAEGRFEVVVSADPDGEGPGGAGDETLPSAAERDGGHRRS